MPENPLQSPLETYNRLLQALDQLGQEVQRVVDAGVREWTALATLDAIELGEEQGMLWVDEGPRRGGARSGPRSGTSIVAELVGDLVVAARTFA